MSRQLSNGATTLPRDFRYHYEDGPKTPEPTNIELRQPSPPRHRLKIRKRQASSLHAPTQQFLASVAAADIPIPTIEFGGEGDLEMVDRQGIPTHTEGLLAPQPYESRAVSPPKTPMPGISVDHSASHRPDWSMGSPSPVEEYFRPSSVMSNHSDMSDDSFYSGGRLSRPSDDGSCPFQSPVQYPVRSKGKAVLIEPFQTTMLLNGKLRSKTRKDAPWTKAQSEHVWRTYNLYLQDPTVTPFRIGASSVPPEGVCYRVARESKRSWRGPKPIPAQFSRLSHVAENSGSTTPTLDLPKVYAPWPHAGAATRNHLRELCKRKNNLSVTTHRHLQSRSPTPFSKPNNRATRLQSPEPAHQTFSVKDMSLVLTTSTAVSMRPDGPLAQLAVSDVEVETPVTKSAFPPLENFEPLSFGRARGASIKSENHGRLGSPFVARTYGPSSSRSINHYGRPSPPPLHSDIGAHLGSPFSKSRSLNGTQKRRAQHNLDEELSPSGAVVRPSVLNEQLFGMPLNSRRVRSRGFSLGDEAFRRGPGIFHSSLDFDVDPPRMGIPGHRSRGNPVSAPMLLPPPAFDPPRLGSPFSESKTFPRRVFPEGTATIRRSQFATMHQSRRSIESFDFGRGPSLQSRLQNLEQKLNQIQERESASKRQSSAE
jgi:hypothetical protein